MRKQTKRKQRHTGLNPVLKALVRRAWDEKVVESKIHALFGGDKDKLLAFASVLIFVAGGSAAHMGWTGDEPDFRILRGSVNALDDLKVRDEITDVDRSSIHAGMLAAHRIIKAAPIEYVNDAAVSYYDLSNSWASLEAA